MGVLEEIIQLKNRGVQDNEIIQMMRDRGVSPREVSDALNQVQIKNAVSDIQGVEIMEEVPQPEIQQEEYPQQYQENFPSQEYYQPIQEQPSNYQGGIDTEIIMEISEQVILEKTAELVNNLRMLNEFKTITLVKLEQLDSRLKKIESIIDKLQISILEKVGSYGENLSSIKKEMSMMQDSFSKVIDPLTELKHMSEKKRRK